MAWDRSSQSPRVGVRGQVTNHSVLHSHVTSCSPLIGQVLTINHAKFSDTGLYTCRGTAAAATIFVYVRDPKQLFLDPRSFLPSNVHTASPTPTNIGGWLCYYHTTHPRPTHQYGFIDYGLQKTELETVKIISAKWLTANTPVSVCSPFGNT